MIEKPKTNISNDETPNATLEFCLQMEVTTLCNTLIKVVKERYLKDLCDIFWILKQMKILDIE